MSSETHEPAELAPKANSLLSDGFYGFNRDGSCCGLGGQKQKCRTMPGMQKAVSAVSASIGPALSIEATLKKPWKQSLPTQPGVGTAAQLKTVKVTLFKGNTRAGATARAVRDSFLSSRRTDTHRQTQTHRDTDTQTHRHTDTQTHTHTEANTHTHTETHRHTETNTDTQRQRQTHRDRDKHSTDTVTVAMAVGIVWNPWESGLTCPSQWQEGGRSARVAASSW